MGATNTTRIPEVIKPFLAKPPLVRGESAKEYRRFLDGLFREIEPQEIIEWLWTIRFANAMWVAQRWRYYRDVYMDARCQHALHTVVRAAQIPSTSVSTPATPFDIPTVEETVALAAVAKRSDELLKRLKVDPDLIPATAMVEQLDTIEAIERLIERAERHADEVVQQLDTRRAVFAARVREVRTRPSANLKDMSQSSQRQMDDRTTITLAPGGG